MTDTLGEPQRHNRLDHRGLRRRDQYADYGRMMLDQPVKSLLV